jgi:hypothetical protein
VGSCGKQVNVLGAWKDSSRPGSGSSRRKTALCELGVWLKWIDDEWGTVRGMVDDK